MIYPHSLRQGLRLGAICAMALAVVAAHADYKVVSKTTISTPRGPQVVTVITFFKGSKVRIDTRGQSGELSEISDSRTHKTIFINHTNKRYMLVDNSATMKQVAASIRNQHMKITAHIKASGKHKMIAGHNAAEYVGTLNVNGDFPERPGMVAKGVVQIDEWTMPGKGISVSQDQMFGSVGNLLHSLAGVGGMSQVTKELSKIKGIPLNVNVVATVTLSTASGGSPQTEKHTFSTEAQFVNELPLPNSAFAVPKDYQQVDSKGSPIASSTGKSSSKGKKGKH